MPIYAHWILFSLLIPFIFIASIIFLAYLWKRNPPTKEQKKISSLNCLKYILFYWLLDLFYMAWFNDWIVWEFIFGGLIIVIIFYNLSAGFTSSKKRSGLENAGFIQDFIIGVGLTIYLLYIIPDPSLQEIMVPLISAIYGGLITLVGVAWTIKKSDKNKRDNEVKKAEPLFSFSMLYTEPKADDYKKLCISSYEININYECEAYFVLENSNQSAFEMKSIYHDGKKYELEGNTRMIPASPNDECLVSFLFSSPNDIYLEIEDILGNIFYYQIKVLCKFNKLSSNRKYLYTVREIKKIDILTLNKEVKEALTTK